MKHQMSGPVRWRVQPCIHQEMMTSESIASDDFRILKSATHAKEKHDCKEGFDHFASGSLILNRWIVNQSLSFHFIAVVWFVGVANDRRYQAFKQRRICTQRFHDNNFIVFSLHEGCTTKERRNFVRFPYFVIWIEFKIHPCRVSCTFITSVNWSQKSRVRIHDWVMEPSHRSFSPCYPFPSSIYFSAAKEKVMTDCCDYYPKYLLFANRNLGRENNISWASKRLWSQHRRF
jgi:hypothetical protein